MSALWLLLKIVAGLVCSVLGLIISGLGLMVAYRNSGPKVIFTCTTCGKTETHYVRNMDEYPAALAKCPFCPGGRQTMRHL